jgi:tetratricopeptide (TPR) repeat protein
MIIDSKEAGIMLDAQYLLTGSIQSAGNIVRIRVQLIQSNNQYQVWASSYDKDSIALNTFEIQDDIVRHVVNQIGGSHGIIFREAAKNFPEKQILDIKVYDAVFWYYYVVNGSTEEIHLKALESMQQSIHLDPKYALGWAILSETYVAGFFRGYNCLVNNPLEEAVRCGQEALKIELQCQHAYQSLALAYLFLHKRKDCLHIIDQWVKLKSNSASISGGLGFCLICAGDYERGSAMLYNSIQLNPYYQWWFNAGLSIYHFQKAEYEETVYWAEKMQRQSVSWELLLKIAAYSEMLRFEEAKTCSIELQTTFPGLPYKSKEFVSAFIQSDELVNRLLASLNKVELNNSAG